MKYDLHVHTYYSDGLYSPTKVVDYAIEKGLDGIAITDHDSVMGIEEALLYSKKFNGFNIIPGIELSCTYDNREVHILGYFIDYRDEKILSVTKDLRENRKERVRKIVEKLNALNIKIDIKNIKDKSNNEFTGRVAIARELINIGYTSTIQEDYD
ncbi:MAG: PHP domain-containing protein, partial [Tissierella sp.]|nr:PHP domain-containing protein [Tissierella sp.]